jgi:alanine dehydrogenase
VTEIPVFDSDAVLAAVPATAAIERTRIAFERHAAGDWSMPAKVYVDAPPGGDFRAMPARGDGLATLKWVTTSLRTGAAAAVSAQVLAREDARSVGVIGCGVNGGWAARCLASAGYGPGVCADARPAAAEALAAELGWQTGGREDAAAQEVIVTVTPADAPVITVDDLRHGQHLAVLGADAHGKSEVERAALARCRLFCDEWEQASKGGELSGGFAARAVARGDVTEIGDVLLGRAPGRGSAEEITLFDSTGLAIQDLAIAAAVLDAWRADLVSAPTTAL